MLSQPLFLRTKKHLGGWVMYAMGLYILSSVAWAAGGQAPSGIQRWGGFITLIFIFVIFYLLLILPQQKRQKQHKKMIEALKRGDEVITMGGVHGTIVQLDDATVVLRVDKDKDIKIRVNRNAIAAVKSGKE